MENTDPKKLKIGDRLIDATGMPLVDVAPEVINSYVKFRPGAEQAMANIERLKPEEMERAGINEKFVQSLITLIAEYRQTDELHPPSAKLTEMLYETKLERAHRISQGFGEVVSQARRRADRDPKGAEILGPLQDLIDYQLAPAKKAVATKKKAKKGKGDSTETAAPEGSTRKEASTSSDSHVTK